MPFRGIPIIYKKSSSMSDLLRMLSKNGKLIQRTIFEQNPHKGARTGIFVGPQGSGKTTALAQLALEFLDRRYTVIWREIELAQFHRIQATGVKVRVFAHALDDIEVLAMQKGSMDSEPYKVRLHRYEDAYDLFEKPKPGVVNVVFEPSYYVPSREFLEDVMTQRSISKHALRESRSLPSSAFWIELTHVLKNRRDRRWFALFEDEADDVYPAIPTGIEWTLMKWARDQVKHLRKSFVATYLATQSYSNLNWEVAEKFQDLFLMKGARKPKRSRVNQKWLDRDELFAEAERKNMRAVLVESEGLIGMIAFRPLPEVDFDLQVIKNWRGEKLPLMEVLEEYGLVSAPESKA